MTYIQKADELILYEQYIRCQTGDDEELEYLRYFKKGGILRRILRRDVLIDFAPLIE